MLCGLARAVDYGCNYIFREIKETECAVDGLTYYFTHPEVYRSHHQCT